MIETSSALLRLFFGRLRQTAAIFGKCSEMFRSVHLAFGTILENLRKSSESGQKSSEIVKNVVISM